MLLQVAPYDPRHTAQTMCQASRHGSAAGTIHIYVYEDTPEALARHILLLGILLDSSLLPSDRVTMFLEVFGNLFIREETSKYLQCRTKQLENIVNRKISGSGSGEDDLMHQLLDLSLMRFEAKDKLLSAIVQSRSSPSIDVKHAWDTRSRKWYGDRYDFRKNAVCCISTLAHNLTVATLNVLNTSCPLYNFRTICAGLPSCALSTLVQHTQGGIAYADARTKCNKRGTIMCEHEARQPSYELVWAF